MHSAPPVIFADMDGVLATSSTAPAIERLRPVCVRRFDGLVKRTGARVVISSTWRESCAPVHLRAYLAHHGYTGGVDSVTPILKGHTRGAEIRAWLDAHDAWGCPFVVLDDWPFCEFAGLLDRLVQTEYDAGLTDEDCARAERLLAAQRETVRVYVPATVGGVV
jgi:hypothetical protein